MLRIGKLTDYAMLILTQMAKYPTTTLSASALAESLHLTTATVSKILKILTEASLVSSVRGVDGGYHLAKSADTITIATVIAVMEGALAMTECCHKTNRCGIDSFCTLRENWRKINKMIYLLLEKLTISDMLQPLCLQGLLHD